MLQSEQCRAWPACLRSFVLFLRAARLEARHVNDWSDHVWAEYWSAAQQRWVHLDPCEGAFDKPLLYEVAALPWPVADRASVSGVSLAMLCRCCVRLAA